MPQPRRSPPRHKIRRSRSYSPGKIQSRSFERKRSRSRERRSSRSPQRKRSEDVKYRSPPPSSHIPRPHFEDKGFPVKRPADSSGKRPVHRSRSPSPSPVKKSKADRAPSPYGKRPAQRSPSPHGGKQRFPNRPEPSSSKAPLFPAAKKQAEIDYVTIVNKGSKMELLSKRFETPDQRLSHGFDFEENITIGIHRGPSHIQLDDGEDVPVNYHFNTKTFRMLFPKKVYDKTLFDRDEIKAFRHDDILDEEAYVEKRTISVKPVDKPKSGKSHDLDYKVSVGRDEYGDRRMVKDSRGHGSRSDMYDDVPVTVRLDPKPDPRYEKLYKEQKRYEDTSMLHDDVQRNPNDLRYNLMRRKSEGDRGDKQGLDARSRIDARRHDDLVSDRHRSSRSLSPEEKYKRRMDQPHLPDFKNRPGNLNLKGILIKPDNYRSSQPNAISRI
ncbi:hypothetical protein DPMN_021205 [Dreissena polymorpha]|uniref:Uncharacterized protein n=1 Tax=Dreissena polymorpha TaxID=45954 RepID=A0A9D4NLN2_DREPO|nr:hypothetical protein DPMN_021205 [Dreissena polymorpha]